MRISAPWSTARWWCASTSSTTTYTPAGPASFIAPSKTPPRPLEPSITAPLPWTNSACITAPSSLSYTEASEKPKASVSCLIAAFASAYSSVG